MESGSELGACADYDVHGGRLVVMTSRGRHEIQVRPQVHRLVRYMAERNAASAGASVLCSNDELMNAVWGEEPMHTHTELARLVWELRRELEPLGATAVVVNERRRGYRLVTCTEPKSGASETAADARPAPGSVSRPTPDRRTHWIVAALIALAVVALDGRRLGTVGRFPRRRDDRVDECRCRHVRRSDRERARAVGSRTTRNRRSVERRVQLLDFARRSRTSNRQRRRQPPEHPRATRQHPGADGRDRPDRDPAATRAAAVDRSRSPLPRWLPRASSRHTLSTAVQSELRPRREGGHGRHCGKETVRRCVRLARARTRPPNMVG